MSDDMRTSRLARLVGEQGVESLSKVRFMVIGLGGVGSNCVEALARGGVGSFVLVDSDIVEQSNINRQAIAFESTIGKPKVDVMRDMVLDINPKARIDILERHILPADVESLFEAHHVDYCIDAQDTIVTKLSIADYCCTNDIPLLSSMGAANTFNPCNLEFADIYETRSCPLSRIVRKQARKVGIERMQVLYNPETPAITSVEEGAWRNDRSDLGTMSYMPAIMGQMLAAKSICDVLGIEWQ